MKRFVVLFVGVVLALLPGVVTAQADTPRPVVYSGIAALANGALRPDTDPDGANDWSCRPSAAHPRPVVLVHGTAENMTYNWFTLAPLLRNEGYCVFALNYGETAEYHIGLPGSLHTYGAAHIPGSAQELSAFVDKVLAATGTSKVDLVGHSQGGMMPRYYLKFLGGASKVDKLVALSPSNHGTNADGLALLPGVPFLLTAGLGPAAEDQLAGSPLLQQLNAGGDTVPGVTYTVIQTRYDEIVTPYTSAFLTGPDVTNILLQDQCPLDTSEHLGISFDSIALRDVLNALDPAHTQAPDCTLTLPINGGGYDAQARAAATWTP
ncbi:pimeloyl-ACP methyl ester carboxylesterase [Amycolatopsis bartoniae]|uniref:Lipase n=1 Tax=Amycolatopsis bartoniae TaxID=941986 RepID=A0A8H9J010_9PSEU|nr:alpha/beta fold hydrolase [Amycolatopsis bartoniae]MBB2933754.1 pimeloyl-ACP methyl ester carboxylesterase [Amycolatopsis bartoniae]TVT10581.1 alpha/beta fold hydrolase [Amycolatopsis bartoniae]GHF71933.1 lipase [Amycolatopsis bartoniae]